MLKRQRELVEKYKQSSGDEARALKKEIEEMANPINERLSADLYQSSAADLKCTKQEFMGLHPFHWGFEFSDVFADGGFDVIIGNPPYIQLQKMSKSPDARVKLARTWYEISGYKTFASTGDIYCLFYERSNDLLKGNGILSYITSNKWMRSDYGGPLRDYFIKNTEVRHIIDMADLRVFKTAVVECGILSQFSRKFKSETDKAEIRSCELSDDSELQDIARFFDRTSSAHSFRIGEPWAINSAVFNSINEKMKRFAIPLKDWDVLIYRGILTGYNDAYLIDDSVRNEIVNMDPKSAQLMMRALRGKDVKRYQCNFAELYLINVHNGLKGSNIPAIDVNEYPPIKEHLDRHYESLSKRGDKGTTPYNLRNCAYLEDLTKQKIVWGELSDHPKFALDLDGRYCPLNTMFMMVGGHLPYLLVVLNSKFSEYVFSYIGTTTGMGTTRWLKYKIEQLPVPKIDGDAEKKFEDIALRLVDAYKNGGDVKALESTANRMVYEIYRLDKEEIQEIEGTIL